jgi:hypothetical protein
VPLSSDYGHSMTELEDEQRIYGSLQGTIWALS